MFEARVSFALREGDRARFQQIENFLGGFKNVQTGSRFFVSTLDVPSHRGGFKLHPMGVETTEMAIGGGIDHGLWGLWRIFGQDR